MRITLLAAIACLLAAITPSAATTPPTVAGAPLWQSYVGVPTVWNGAAWQALGGDATGAEFVNFANPATSCSGTITTGGTAQTITGFTHGFSITNPSASAVLWLSKFGTAAANASGSIPVASLATYTTAPNETYSGTLSIESATSSAPFTCTLW